MGALVVVLVADSAVAPAVAPSAIAVVTERTAAAAKTYSDQL